MITSDDVNLRAEPSPEAEVVATLAAGTELLLTGATEPGEEFVWYEVENPETGDFGWVIEEFLDFV